MRTTLISSDQMGENAAIFDFLSGWFSNWRVNLEFGMIRCAVNQQRRSDAGRGDGDHCLPLSLQYDDESVVQERLPRSSRSIKEILILTAAMTRSKAAR